MTDGNQLRSINDYISPIAYNGSPDFKDNAMLTPSGSSEYQYGANIVTLAFSFGYNLGYVIEDITGTNIQINPYTLDFTPIEQTLQEADEMGIIIY